MPGALSAHVERKRKFQARKAAETHDIFQSTPPHRTREPRSSRASVADTAIHAILNYQSITEHTTCIEVAKELSLQIRCTRDCHLA